MPRQIFRNLVIAAAGPLPGQLTIDNLKQWTKLRRGAFTEDFDEDVTHLLCTREQFNQKVPRVKEALARGKRFHIVHYDWFEFSAINEKKQPEREYSMRSILAKQNAAKREQARIEKGKREGERAVNTNFFHIYHDRTFFPYQIDLTRDDEETGELGQRYTLCLWESNAKPHLYWFTAKFMKKKGDSQPSYYRPSVCSGPWRQEMNHFMELFRIKAGIEWEDRVLRHKTMSASFFQYSPPTGGKPVGRRLRFCYEYCLEINAQLRGLPWPPVEEIVTEREVGDPGARSPSEIQENDHLTESTGAGIKDTDSRSPLSDEDNEHEKETMEAADAEETGDISPISPSSVDAYDQEIASPGCNSNADGQPSQEYEDYEEPKSALTSPERTQVFSCQNEDLEEHVEQTKQLDSGFGSP